MSWPSRITGSVNQDRLHFGHSKSRVRSNFKGEGDVPNAKKPMNRPPDDLRDKLARMSLTRSALPKYTGPYNVGMMDIEVLVREPRMHEAMTREGRHILRLETVLFSIYYPTLDTSKSPEPTGRKEWSRETWLPRPRVSLAKGYGRFAGIDNIPHLGRASKHLDVLTVPFFALTTMLTKLPALRNARIARDWPPGDPCVGADGKTTASSDDEDIVDSEGRPVFPMFIFSHGLGGTRSVYSILCGEFASYGNVVVALEHRDGSGPRTYINHPKVKQRPYTQEVQRIVDDHDPKDVKRGYHKVDYIFPKDNTFDTLPHNKKGVDSDLRSAQMTMRIAEIEEAYHIMTLICEGRGEEVAERNMRRKGYKAASSRGLGGIDWSQWKGAFHLDGVTILGHSFGAATTVELLRKSKTRFPNIRQGIIYDIWGAALRTPENPIEQHIAAPLLAINSEAFTYWPTNFQTVDSLVAETRSSPHPAPSCLLTVRGTIHVSQSDFSILYPKLCAFGLRATANPNRAMDVNVSASFEFLRRIDERVRAMARHTMFNREMEGFILADTVARLPSGQAPKDKDVAMKIKGSNKAIAVRMFPRWMRKQKRAANRKKGWTVSDEVWVHARSSIEEVEAWLEGHPEHTKPSEKRFKGVTAAVGEQGVLIDPNADRINAAQDSRRIEAREAAELEKLPTNT